MMNVIDLDEKRKKEELMKNKDILDRHEEILKSFDSLGDMLDDMKREVIKLRSEVLNE